MSKRYILYILIGVVCTVAIILGVYYQLNADKPETKEYNENEVSQPVIKDDKIDLDALLEEFNGLFDNSFNDQDYDTTGITKITGLEDQDIIYAAYNIKEEKDEKYSVDINLPVFNIDGEVAAEFNSTTQKIFADKANDVLSKAKDYTIYNSEYTAYLNDNILSLVIKSNLKEGNNAERVIVQTYNYDIVTKKALTLNDVLDQKEIKTKTVNKKIDEVVKQADKESKAVADALAQAGQTVYERDVESAIYVTDNVNNFFLGKDGQIYIVYAYGNTNFTSEMDIIKL